MSIAKGTTIYLFSLDKNLIQTFHSSRMAAKHFNTSNGVIMRYTRSGKIYKEKYILSLKEIYP
jgi:hypothetical protein